MNTSTPKGFSVIFFIVVGVVSLAYVRNSSKLDRVGIYWALATGAAIAVYTVVDGLGVRRVTTPCATPSCSSSSSRRCG